MDCAWCALRNPELDAALRHVVRGERFIWAILAMTGLVSIIVSRTAIGQWAAMIYATLPLTIGLFAWRYDWNGGAAPTD